MTDWKKYKLGNLCLKITSGGTPSTVRSEFYSGEIPWLKTQEVNFNRIYKTETSITEGGLKNSSAKWIEKNSVIVAMYGNTAAKVAINKIPLTTNQACCNITLDNTKANYEFVYYYLLFNYEKLRSLANGGAQQNLNAGIIRDYLISIPDIYTQTRIASILSSLDDKIELNRRMNQTLEQMAQALFNHYFVDNIDPDNLPEGWRIGKLGDYIQTVSKTHSFQKPEIIFLNTSDISEGNVLHSKYSPVEGLPGQAKKSIKQNDILFSEIRPANKRYAFINFDAENYVVSTKLMVLRSKSNIDSIFFYFLLTQEQTLVYLQNIAESRSGTFPQITFDQVKEIEFVIPTEEFLKQFIERTLKPTFELIFNNEKESKSLSTIRDTLLPKLMSGEIDVDKK